MSSTHSMEHTRLKLADILAASHTDPQVITRHGKPAGRIIPAEENVMVTTVYATWQNVMRDTLTVAEYVKNSLVDFADAFDLAGLEAAFRGEIDKLLPEGVTLHGEEFIGPYYNRPDFDVEELRGKIELNDKFWQLAGRFELDPIRDASQIFPDLNGENR